MLDETYRDSYGGTVAHWAARHNVVGVMEKLIADGEVDLNGRDMYGSTPLVVAASCEHGEVVRMLVAAGVDLDARGRPFKILLRRRSALHYAASGGDVGVVRLLVSAGADVGLPDRSGWTALQVADADDVVEVLTGA